MRGVLAWETKKKGVGVTHLQIKAEHSNTEIQSISQKGKEKRREKKKKTKQ